MPHHITPDDPRLQWAGAVSVEAGDGWAMPWRLPHQDRVLYDPELLIRAAHPSGVRLVFRTDSSSIEVHCDPVEERTPVELVVDGQVVASAETANQSTLRFDVPASVVSTEAHRHPEALEGRAVGAAERPGVGSPDSLPPEGEGQDGGGSGLKTIELWLPLVGEFRLRGLTLSPGAELSAPSPLPRGEG